MLELFVISIGMATIVWLLWEAKMALELTQEEGEAIAALKVGDEVAVCSPNGELDRLDRVSKVYTKTLHIERNWPWSAFDRETGGSIRTNDYNKQRYFDEMRIRPATDADREQVAKRALTDEILGLLDGWDSSVRWEAMPLDKLTTVRDILKEYTTE